MLEHRVRFRPTTPKAQLYPHMAHRFLVSEVDPPAPSSLRHLRPLRGAVTSTLATSTGWKGSGRSHAQSAPGTSLGPDPRCPTSGRPCWQMLSDAARSIPAPSESLRSELPSAQNRCLPSSRASRRLQSYDPPPRRARVVRRTRSSRARLRALFDASVAETARIAHVAEAEGARLGAQTVNKPSRKWSKQSSDVNGGKLGNR